MSTNVCRQCKKPFETHDLQQKYCSHKCYALSIVIFNEIEKREIRALYDSGQSASRIARIKGVNPSTISRVLWGK